MRPVVAINLLFSPLRSNFIKPQIFRLFRRFLNPLVYIHQNSEFISIYTNCNINKKGGDQQKTAPALFFAKLLKNIKGILKYHEKLLHTQKVVLYNNSECQFICVYIRKGYSLLCKLNIYVHFFNKTLSTHNRPSSKVFFYRFLKFMLTCGGILFFFEISLVCGFFEWKCYQKVYVHRKGILYGE